MDFSIKILKVIKIGGVDVWITETTRNIWIIMGMLTVFAIVARVNLKKTVDVPSGLQNAVETAVEAFDKFLLDSAGEKLMFLGNWYFMVFAFIIVSNLSGLIFLRPPTADWTVTFPLAFTTFVLIQGMGIKYRKGKFVKSLFEPSPIFFPLNVIGELARPISLSFRLFGNILAGMILMSLLYAVTPLPVRFVIPIPLHMFFDLFAGVLQTYIFSILSLSFIGISASAE